jgi:hypothetical protein
MSDQRSLERDATPGERIALTVADRVPGWRGLAAAIDDAIRAAVAAEKERLAADVREWCAGVADGAAASATAADERLGATWAEYVARRIREGT